MSFLRTITKSEFLSHIVTLLSGTVLSQAIFILFTPLLSRLYSPLEFGMYAIYMNILGPLSIIVTGRYEQAIVIPDKDEDAINIYAIVVILSFICSLALIIIFALFNDQICNLLNAGIVGKWLFLIPVSIIFLSFSQSSTYWFIRKKGFKASAINKISQSSLNVASSVPLGYFKISKGLLIGDALGKCGLALVSFYLAVKSGLSPRLINIKSIKYNITRFKQFPLFNTIPSFLVTLSLSLPIFYINKFYSGSDTGLVNQTRIAILIPLSLVSASLSQVILQRFSEKFKKGIPIKDEFIYMLRNIAILGIAVILIIQIGGVTLFRIVFGKEWSMSGVFSKFLVFSYAIQFVASPFSVVFIAYEKIKILSFWQYFYFGCILLLYFARFYDLVHFLVIYTVVEFFCYSVFLYLIFKVVSDHEKRNLEC